jgi:hypothetical protein
MNRKITIVFLIFNTQASKRSVCVCVLHSSFCGGVVRIIDFFSCCVENIFDIIIIFLVVVVMRVLSSISIAGGGDYFRS